MPSHVLNPFPVLAQFVLTLIHWLGVSLPRLHKWGEWNPQRVWLPLIYTGNEGRMKIAFGLFTRMCDKVYFMWNQIYNFYIILLWLLTQLVKSLLFIANIYRCDNKALLILWVYENSLKDPATGSEECCVMFSEDFKQIYIPGMA